MSLNEVFVIKSLMGRFSVFTMTKEKKGCDAISHCEEPPWHLKIANIRSCCVKLLVSQLTCSM